MSSARTELAATLDTNEIVSGTIIPASVPGQVLRAWRRGVFRLVSSPALVAEAAEVLARPRIRDRYHLTQTDIDQLIEALAAVVVEPLALDILPIHCRDPKDDKVLACALGGQADVLVTGDDDLLVLDGDPTLGALRIMTPRALLTALEPHP